MRTLIVQGRKEIFREEVYEAVLPGMDGEFSVMDFHQPFLYRLRKGILKIYSSAEAEADIFDIEDGVAKFIGNSLVILCEKR